MKISRSFSRKVQLKQFEPIESFCAAEIEIDYSTGDVEGEKVSAALDKFCRAEVEKTIQDELAKAKAIDKKKSKDVGRDSAELDTNQE